MHTELFYVLDDGEKESYQRRKPNNDLQQNLGFLST